MFKKFGMLLLAACFLFSTQAEAGAADQIGVYVTPKFVYGIMGGNKAKAHSYEAGVSETKNLGSLDDVVGGALAIGYDFHKRFNVPIRAELEYSAFGDAKASKSWGTPDDTDRDGIYYQSMKQRLVSRLCLPTSTTISGTPRPSRRMLVPVSAWDSSAASPAGVLLMTRCLCLPAVNTRRISLGTLALVVLMSSMTTWLLTWATATRSSARLKAEPRSSLLMESFPKWTFTPRQSTLICTSS